MNSRGRGLGTGLVFLAGVGLGAGLMALLDPGRGAWRRSYIRDKAVHGVHFGRRAGLKQLKRLKNEIIGSVAEGVGNLRDRNIDDEILVDRVRAQVGHVIGNMGLLEIKARDGHVTLWGHVLRGERDKIIHRLSETRGVHNYYVQVEEHDSLDDRRMTEPVHRVDNVRKMEAQHSHRAA